MSHTTNVLQVSFLFIEAVRRISIIRYIFSTLSQISQLLYKLIRQKLYFHVLQISNYILQYYNSNSKRLVSDG